MKSNISVNIFFPAAVHKAFETVCEFIAASDAETQLLSTSAKPNLGDRVLSEVAKNIFIFFARQRWTQQAKALKIVSPKWGGKDGIADKD